MKILITGGAGFIGSWLCESLLDQGYSIIIIDNLSPQVHGAIPKLNYEWKNKDRIEFIRADIRDSKVMNEVLSRVNYVVHLAAETGTGQSMYQISHYYEVNQQATASMLEAIGTRHRHIKRIIIASSRSIYGEGAYSLENKIITPQPRDTKKLQAGIFEPLGPNGETLNLVATEENAMPRPASVYAATKLANETLSQIFADAYNICVVALRFQNVYGERQSLKNPYTGLLSIFSNRMRQNLPINIFEDGLESRDFVHVSDVVKAINLALEQPISGFKAINIGSGIPTSVLQIANILRKTLNSESTLNITGDFRAGDIRHCYADLRKAKSILNYAPLTNIEEGLNKFCKWVKTQPLPEDNSEKAMKELAEFGLSKIKTK